MDIETVKAICKEFDGHCGISVDVSAKGEARWSFSFWGFNKEEVRAIKKRYGLGNMDKLFRGGDEDWRVGRLTFNQVVKCKITGYDEEVIPEHVRRTPIYDCKGGK